MNIKTILYVFVFIAIFAVSGFALESGTIKGKVKATSVSQSTFLPGAKLTLTNLANPERPFTAQTNDGGEFIFANLPAGSYVLLVESSGLANVSRAIKLDSGAVLTVEIEMAVTIGETVNVRIEEGLLSTSETSISNVIRAETLKTEPFRDDNFQNSIGLTPGVVRDGKNNNYLKGARTGQSGYKVNGADVTDPVTGNVAFEIPLEAAATVEVEESPYSSEFGQFTGGITNLQTKGGGEKFKFSAARLFPTFRGIVSSKVESFRPRITASGPILKDKVFFLQSFEYRFRGDRVTSLPKDQNRITTESFNAFSQVDWNINKSNNLKFNFAMFPSKIRNLNLDTFNPAETSPNYKQRGMLFSGSEQTVFKNSSFLSTDFSYKIFDVDVFAKSSQPFEITPEVNRGGYFADTRRQTTRWQWRENYYFQPMKAFGEHLVKTGIEMFGTNVKGVLTFSPIFIRRLDGTLGQQINFQNAAPFAQSFGEIGFYVQDRWTLNPKLTFDYGARIDRDGVSRKNNFSPRFSILYSFGNSGKTIIRAGAGIFYDRTSPIAGRYEEEAASGIETYLPNFQQIPARLVTNFAANGTTVLGVPVLYSSQMDGLIRTPRSTRWSFQVDQGITKEFTMRFGYMKRKLKNDLIFDPTAILNNAASISLSSRGHSEYNELQFVATFKRPGFGRWNASYVFSRAQGDLNTADKLYGDSPAFVVRQNEYSKLAFDVPHRVLIYGQLDFKHDIRIAPLFEMRSGFPFSTLDERLNFVDGGNLSGRFPTYMSLDFQVTKGVKLPFFDNKKVRVGIALFNLTNHFNPRDIQSNLTSPNFGKLYNSLGTEIKAKFDFDF